MANSFIEEFLGKEEKGLPAIPKFESAAFQAPTFDPEDIGFTERKSAPLDLSGIFKQAKQRQAVTGVEPSAEFVSGIAEPALREKTREAIGFEELNRQRELEQRKQAFTEFSTTRGQEFQEFASERDIAFDQFKIEQERDVERERLRIAEIQAKNSGDDGCIIVTACHGKDSEEVNITRRYRDEFLNKETLRGYYMLAEQVVPTMEKEKGYNEYMKDNFVDHFIDVGKYRLGMTDEKPSDEAINITDGFLSTCTIVGNSVDSFTRSNGEVI